MRRNPGNNLGDVRICPDAKSGLVRKMQICNAEKSGQSLRGCPNMPGCEIRFFQENPDMQCGEIRAITSGMSEFVRMRNPDLSGKSMLSGFACGLQIRSFQYQIRSFPYPIRSLYCKTMLLCIFEYVTTDLSGCVMRRNPGNHLWYVRICPDANSKFVRIQFTKIKTKSIAALKKTPRGPSAETAF